MHLWHYSSRFLTVFYVLMEFQVVLTIILLWYVISTFLLFIKENTAVQEVRKQCMMFVITVLKS